MRLLIVLATLLTFPIWAKWERRTLTLKGERVDTPDPHPLSYFTRYPSLRDEDGDFCHLCPPDKALALAKQQKERAEVRLIGKIRGFAIYDVLYYFGDEQEPGWKSILVQTQTNQYR